MNNLAFIDGQNLYMGTQFSHESWKVDFVRFRIYLEAKYKVKKAYYFPGYKQAKNASFYAKLQKAGFVLIFKEHTSAMHGKKKGNVDSDIIFAIMKALYLKEDFDQVVLVSGDGDYKMLVDFLIKENRFSHILFPNKKRCSSLYKKLSNRSFSYLDDAATKAKIEGVL